jgi:hypothetical protein
MSGNRITVRARGEAARKFRDWYARWRDADPDALPSKPHKVEFGVASGSDFDEYETVRAVFCRVHLHPVLNVIDEIGENGVITGPTMVVGRGRMAENLEEPS